MAALLDAVPVLAAPFSIPAAISIGAGLLTPAAVPLLRRLTPDVE